MKTHYSEADLLETYYLQPGESMPVMMHLAQCSDCAARYERLERKLRDLAACDTERPETFWSRQRHLIMRGIRTQPQAKTSRVARTLRVAATAAFAFFLGGAVMYKTLDVPPQAPPMVIPQASAEAPSEDPWESSELQKFHSVVEWESWVDSSAGDQL